MLTHPTLDQLRALMLDGHGAGLRRTRSAIGGPQSRARRMAGAAARPRGRKPQYPGASRPDCASLGCVTVSRDRGRRLLHAPSARQGAVPAAGHLPLDRRPRQSSGHRSVRCRQVVVILCTRAESLPRRLHVHYARVPRLFADLDLAHGDGRFARLFRMLVKIDLLVLDDWGPDRLSASQRRDLMEIVEDRHERGSILITSQLPVATWHEVVIGEPTLGDAILDRIVHNPAGSSSMACRCASSKPPKKSIHLRSRRRRFQPKASRPREQRNEMQPLHRPPPWVKRPLLLLTTETASTPLDDERAP
jgi:hypothetical protein